MNCLYDAHNYPSIVLNEDGVCDICISTREILDRIRSKRSNDQINELLKTLKSSKSGNYDCIIGVSGGADSSFLVHKAKEWNLNPLLIHIDGGWNSEISAGNIRKLVQKTGFSLHTVVLPWDEIRDVQKAFIKANVLDIDLPFDNAMLYYLYKTAKDFKVKYILNGYNFETEGLMPNEYTHYKLDKKNILDIHRKFGSSAIHNIRFIGTMDFFRFERIHGIRFIQPLDYMNYNKKEAVQLMTDLYDWKDYGEKHHENLYTRFYQSYILPEKFGIDKRIAHYSILICSNQITKAEALELIRIPTYEPKKIEKEKAYFLKKMQISEEEFDDYIKAPRVDHFKFRSELSFYRRVKPVYRILKRIFRFNLFSKQ